MLYKQPRKTVKLQSWILLSTMGIVHKCIVFIVALHSANDSHHVLFSTGTDIER